jgi:hypothetical protein
MKKWFFVFFLLFRPLVLKHWGPCFGLPVGLVIPLNNAYFNSGLFGHPHPGNPDRRGTACL